MMPCEPPPVAGLVPRWTSSIYTCAPAGFVSTVSVPVPGAMGTVCSVSVVATVAGMPVVTTDARVTGTALADGAVGGMYVPLTSIEMV